MIKVLTGKVSLISYLTKAYSYATILEINLSSKVNFITPGFKTYALTTRLMLVKCGIYHKASSRTFQIYPVYRDSLCMIEKGVFTPKKAEKRHAFSISPRLPVQGVLPALKPPKAAL